MADVTNFGSNSELISEALSLKNKHEKEWVDLIRKYYPSKNVSFVFRTGVSLHGIPLAFMPKPSKLNERLGEQWLSYFNWLSGIEFNSERFSVGSSMSSLLRE
jgi:hypothetical protein